MLVSELLEGWEEGWHDYRSSKVYGQDRFVILTDDDRIYHIRNTVNGWRLEQPGTNDDHGFIGHFEHPGRAIAAAVGNHDWQVLSRDGKALDVGPKSNGELSPQEIATRDRRVRAEMMRRKKAYAGGYSTRWDW